MHITTERVLAAEMIAELYPVYARAWDRLLIHAAARHVLSAEEFAEEMRDGRIEKLIVRDEDGAFLGMTTLTNDMAAIPWVNPRHYAFRYPDAAERNALFYLGYMFVDQTHRHHNLLKLMTAAIDERLSGVGGVVGFDICSFNIEHGMGRRMASLLATSDRIDTLDSQTYYAADYRGVEVPSAPTTTLADAYDLMTLAERPELMDEVWQLLASRWPAYIVRGHHGHEIDLEKLMINTAEQQVLLFDAYDALCGVGFSAPLWWDGTAPGLPAGRDDAIRRSFELVEDGRTANTLCALTVTISPDARGYGLAGRVIGGINAAAAEMGAQSLIAPVRPNLKHHYPLIPMADYLTWRTDDGEMFDPSLRLHLRHGGDLLGIAEDSMVIRGRVQEWEEWLGLALPTSGEYVIESGLAPLVLDRRADQGIYREANVWVHHSVPEPIEDWPDAAPLRLARTA